MLLELPDSVRNHNDVVNQNFAEKFINATINESGFNGLLARGIVLTGGAVDIDGVAEQVSNKSGYLVRKMLPIPLKGIKNSFYSDATVVGIFLEDMEREYKAYLEETRQPAPTIKEKKSFS